MLQENVHLVDQSVYDWNLTYRISLINAPRGRYIFQKGAIIMVIKKQEGLDRSHEFLRLL